MSAGRRGYGDPATDTARAYVRRERPRPLVVVRCRTDQRCIVMRVCPTPWGPFLLLDPVRLEMRSTVAQGGGLMALDGQWLIVELQAGCRCGTQAIAYSAVENATVEALRGDTPKTLRAHEPSEDFF